MAHDLHDRTEIVGCPTVREPDGLALSSRNVYLTPEERRAAPVLFQGVERGGRRGGWGRDRYRGAGRATRARIEAEPLARIDYVEAVDDEELTPVSTLDRPVLLALAVRFGVARLIDNIVLKRPS